MNLSPSLLELRDVPVNLCERFSGRSTTSSEDSCPRPSILLRCLIDINGLQSSRRESYGGRLIVEKLV